MPFLPHPHPPRIRSAPSPWKGEGFRAADSRPYSGKRTRSVGSSKLGAVAEPNHLKFSTPIGRRRRPPTQSPAKRVCVGEEERWSERALPNRAKRGIRNPRRRSGPEGIAKSHSNFARRKFLPIPRGNPRKWGPGPTPPVRGRWPEGPEGVGWANMSAKRSS